MVPGTVKIVSTIRDLIFFCRLRKEYEKASEEIEVAKSKEHSAESAKKRIKQLEQQLVGGEQVGNEALKQKRVRKIKEAETKMQRLAGKYLNISNNSRDIYKKILIKSLVLRETNV